MFEKVYQKAFYLRPHLEAPFLKEREAFVSRLASRGFCVRYQQMVAGYLLFAVQYLGLTDNDHTPVCVKAIWEMGQAYRQMRLSSKRRKNQSADVDTKYQDQIFYTVSWLGKIGMLDSIYSAPDNILNKLMKRTTASSNISVRRFPMKGCPISDICKTMVMLRQSSGKQPRCNWSLLRCSTLLRPAKSILMR